MLKFILSFTHACTQFDITEARKIFNCLWLFCCTNDYLLLKLEACAHPFFDDLREPNACLPNGQSLPPLFDFTAQGKLVTSLPLSVK